MVKNTVTVYGREIEVVPSKFSKRVREVFVVVDVAKFDEGWKRDIGFHIDANGSNQISNRLARVAEFLKTATSMEASEVHVGDTGRIQFTDGRHRMAFLRDYGVKQVGVTMDKKSAKNAVKFGIAVAA